jgi:hypothetical protein
VLGLGCSVCTGGIGTYTFSYTSNDEFEDSYQHWRYKTVETLPDGNQHIVYANFAGQVLLKVFRDTSAEEEWIDFYAYDDAGRLVLHAHPSALTGYDEELPDLLGQVDGNYQYLADDIGLVELTSYHEGTGPEAGYLSEVALQRGEMGLGSPPRQFPRPPVMPTPGSRTRPGWSR